MLMWKIAWRNVWRHKGKSLVLAAILFLGALLMTIGNSVIEGAKAGMSRNMVDRFTGHLVLKSSAQKDDMMFVGGRSSLKQLPSYPNIKAVLQQQELIDGFIPMSRGLAMILNPDGRQGETMVFGINFEEYQHVFLNNLLPMEGELLQAGERGMIITEYTRERVFDRQKFWIIPEGLTIEQTVPFVGAGHYAQFDVQKPELIDSVKIKAQSGQLKTTSELIVLGFGSTSFGTDIQIPVKGIFKFQNLNRIWESISFMDIESFREGFGYISAANNTVELTEQQQNVLNLEADNMDDLFESDDIIEETNIESKAYDLSSLQKQTKRLDKAIDTDQGSYNMVAIKLKPGWDMEKAQKQLQQVFDAAKIPVTVLTWKEAVGPIAQLTDISQGALSVFVLFIFFVAIIVIMNTLSMTALERTTEIGMMRAIGAQKNFISKMFVTETVILSFLFGGAGIIVGVLISMLLASLNIPVDSNNLLSLLFGGDTFQPVIKGSNLLSGTVQLGVVTFLAVLYPLRIARKITPIEAISRD
jgi:putative ABC transport system permease protein